MGRAAGFVSVIVSAVCFGFMALFASWAQADGVSTRSLLFLRFAIAGACLAAIMHARRLAWPRRSTLPGLIVMGAVLYVGEALCYFHGLEYASSGLIALLLYLYPAIVVVLARLMLRERLTFIRLAALGIALAGAVMLLSAHVQDGALSAQGAALGISSALFYAAYIVAGTRFGAQAGALPAATVVVCSAAMVFAVLALAEGLTLPASPRGWAGAVGLAIFSTVIAITALLAGLHRIGAVRASTLSTIEPLVTVIIGITALGDPFSPLQAVGGGLILLAAIIVARTAGNRAPGAAPAPPTQRNFDNAPPNAEDASA